MAQVGESNPHLYHENRTRSRIYPYPHHGLWVSVTLWVTCKPVQYVIIFSLFDGPVCFFLFSFFLNIISLCIHVLYLLYNTVTT